MSEEVLLIHRRWREATRGIGWGAKGLLITLMEMAADAGRPEIPVSLANVASVMTTAEQAVFPAQFAELRLRGLVRQVRTGVFEIAPGLWKVGQPDESGEFIVYD